MLNTNTLVVLHVTIYKFYIQEFRSYKTLSFHNKETPYKLMMLCTCETILSKFPNNSDLASTRSSFSSGCIRQTNARLPSVGKALQAPLRVFSGCQPCVEPTASSG